MFKKFFDQLKLIELYETILDSMKLGIVVVDNDQRVVYANDFIKKIYGKILGKEFCSEILNSKVSPKNNPVLRTLEDGRPHEGEVITGRRHLLIRSYALKKSLKERHAIVMIEETTFKKPFEFLLKTEANMLRNLAENNQKIFKEYNKLKKKMLKISKETKRSK